MTEVSLLEFADKLNALMPVIMREFAKRQANELYKGKITLPQFLILDIIHKEGESKMTDLAHLMDVSTAAMTGIVNRLVKGGYVVRKYDAQDRRIIKVILSSKGNELVKKTSEQRRQMAIKIFGKISESDRRDHLRILGQIRDILLQEKEG
ncbi:MAG: MarR family transcriptional regulator [Candidatus Omnitrophota bacterium]|jgi:DNA-binding MarR family transcriptional regulator